MNERQPAAGRDLPLVSIITPTLNRASYLEGAIASVRAQTYPNLEHLVIDGGSTDGTIEILRRHEADGAIRWLSEVDSGMYNALNKGLRLARGEILAYLNTDDRYFPYSVAVGATRLMARPDIAFVYGDMLNVDEAAGTGSIFFYPPFHRGYLRRGGLIGQPTVFWRAEVTSSVGYLDETLRLGADHEYWRRIAADYVGEKINEVMAFEGEHGGRLTSGESGQRRALEELHTIKARYDDSDAVTAPLHAIADTVRHAFWYRFFALAFLASRLLPTRPGRAWGGFTQERAVWRVSAPRLLLALIPVAGRRHKRGWVLQA